VSGTTLLIGSILLLVVLTVVWARIRAKRIREEAEDRERRALAAMRSGGDPVAAIDDRAAAGSAEPTGETIFEPGTPTGIVPGRGGIEVAEVLDIEELLRDESAAVAARARAQLEEPTNIHSGDTLPPRPVAAPAPPPRPAAPPAPPPPAAQAPAPTAPPGHDVPLRELVLAWFEARGYRSSPASPVVRPIELVLRHRDDPARAYAFVVGTQRVTVERVQQLAQQARSIGLIRVLVVADAGLAPEAANAKRGVRVLDRAALKAELDKLDLSVAAKIIAVARKRAAARAGAH
jgi:hypothetical protein